MDTVRRAPLAEIAADVLQERIRAGEWALGARLPGETTLAAQLEVGRSTVREAIRRLAGRGILESRQGAGVFVIALDAPEEWDAVLRRVGIVAVLEARTAIESEAAGLAAERRTPDDLQAMRRALRARAAGAVALGIEAYVDADTAFHRSIVAAAHNEVLTDLFDGFVPRSRRAMIEMLRIRGVHSAAGSDQTEHDDLADAVERGDAAAARDLSRAHLGSLRVALGAAVPLSEAQQ
ncbi:GntR family transcriptional regulator [Microbacterium mangrovi]|uniref:GntR family transcriptional regulator n=1 Tax=Microbacterium mangrovi TaxID=1348253 RepID=A0A0B2A266_9MICO|nr:FCD domain-containing protein [Microbacterium mangrovi]KHK95879.1 GntR family transcriptional regulator [Microbacterium mangrovi]